MEVQLDCIQCNLRQALGAARLGTSDSDIQKKIVIKSSKVLSNYDSCETPREMGKVVHELVKEYTGNEDPYKKLRESAIRTVSNLYPALEGFVETNSDRIRSALEVSVVGNLLDAVVYGDIRNSASHRV